MKIFTKLMLFLKKMEKVIKAFSLSIKLKEE